MEMSETIGEISGALAKAQSEIQGAVKDADNPFFKSKYADLSSVWEACREQLTKNEIAVIQGLDTEGSNIVVTTTLAHKSGEWMRSSLSWAPEKTNAQGIGSLITYLRRYALSAMVGVAPQDDDDGEAAMGRPQTAKMPTAKAKVPETNNDLDTATWFEDFKAEIDGAVSNEELNEMWQRDKALIKALDLTKEGLLIDKGKARREQLKEDK